MTITTYDLELHDRIPQLVAEYVATCEEDFKADNPADIADISRGVFHLDRKAEECIIVIAMDTRCVPLGAFLVSHGTVSTALASPREMLIRLLLCGAAQFAIVHNHPSGHPGPSDADIELTQRLKDAGSLVGICLVDHIIVGADRRYYSFLQHAMKK